MFFFSFFYSNELKHLYCWLYESIDRNKEKRNRAHSTHSKRKKNIFIKRGKSTHQREYKCRYIFCYISINRNVTVRQMRVKNANSWLLIHFWLFVLLVCIFIYFFICLFVASFVCLFLNDITFVLLLNLSLKTGKKTLCVCVRVGGWSPPEICLSFNISI